MPIMATSARDDGAGATLATLLAQGGSAGHAYPTTLAGAARTGDLSDAVHFLCMLHGRYPGVMDHAADRVFDPVARDWMFRAAAGFAAERAYLTRLVVAAGPVPRRIGQAQSETATAGQAQALAILSQSDRRGTSLGAAFALVLDWTTIRRVLDGAAARFALPAPPCDLPGAADTLALTATLGATPGVGRAIAFGAQQLLLQHRSIWDLLETRAGLES